MLLENISRIQLGGTFFVVKGNTRTPDDVSRGVISGLLPGTSDEELKASLRAPAKYAVLHARMLGQSSAAVIFFQLRTFLIQVHLFTTYMELHISGLDEGNKAALKTA